MQKKGSWRTTLSGILAVVGAILPIINKVFGGGEINQADIGTLLTVIPLAVGLVHAKDAKVTGLPPIGN